MRLRSNTVYAFDVVPPAVANDGPSSAQQLIAEPPLQADGAVHDFLSSSSRQQPAKSWHLSGGRAGILQRWVEQRNIDIDEARERREVATRIAAHPARADRALCLRDYAHIRRLPAGLDFPGGLEMSGWQALRSLPSLRIRQGDLTVEHCVQLEEICGTISLDTAATMTFQGLPRLRNFSAKFEGRVSTLWLNDVASLSTIAGLRVATLDALMVVKAPELLHLPKRLTVGWVEVLGSQKLVDVPTGFRAKERISFEGCTALRRLDDAMPALDLLVLKGCTSFERLPQSCVTWTPHEHGHRREIVLQGTAVPVDEVEGLMALNGGALRILGAGEPAQPFDEDHPFGQITTA